MSTNDPPGLTTHDRRRAESKWSVALLIGLNMTAPLAVDMFLPSMPNMAEEFEAPTATVQLAVTLFLMAFAASQLAYGPVSDRFG
ncbi:MAG: multidrug effflux MFS transporter, partial [Chloroflexi bacterium]|nr:multidrug effflux MFS transporter [Chloroflexota bacterium]